MNQFIQYLLAFLFAQSALALDLRTEDFAIQLPTGWSCDPDESLVICTELNAGRKKSAIILINYKKANPTENLADFRTRLGKIKQTQVANGAPRLSRVVSFQDRVIKGLTWVEALHFEGELPDYYTYYLATLKSQKFFLITLSAHKGSWDKYRPIFEKAIASLEILTPEPQPIAAQPVTATQEVPAPQQAPESNNQFAHLKNVTKGLSPAKLFLYAAVIIGSLLVLYALRS